MPRYVGLEWDVSATMNIFFLFFFRKNKTNIMANLTDCPSCLTEYQDPKLLPCQHTVCLMCLERLEKEQQVTCPRCDVTHKVPQRGVKAFTENQHVIQLVADKKVSSC